MRPPRKQPSNLIIFPSRSTETSVPPPPAAAQAAPRKPVEITRSVSRACLPGVRRRLFLEWIGSDPYGEVKNVEWEMAREAGITTRTLMRMLRAEARAEHRELFFARSPKAA